MTRAIAFLSACLITSSCLAETVTVAAAISLKDALAKAAEQYKADTGEVVEFTLGSSGQLASQIENGAPVDLFISAASNQVDDLIKSGAVDATTRRVVAGNSLVLIVPRGSASPPDSTKALVNSRVSRIAIGEPKSVPAGRYAEQALKHAGVYEAVKHKLVLGTNVRQVLDYVERGEVSAGFVYATDARVSGDRIRVAYVVNASEHDPIEYPAVIVAASKKRSAALRFLDYLLSEKGQASLREFGFAPPPGPATRPTR